MRKTVWGAWLCDGGGGGSSSGVVSLEWLLSL